MSALEIASRRLAELHDLQVVQTPFEPFVAFAQQLSQQCLDAFGAENGVPKCPIHCQMVQLVNCLLEFLGLRQHNADQCSNGIGALNGGMAIEGVHPFLITNFEQICKADGSCQE